MGFLRGGPVSSPLIPRLATRSPDCPDSHPNRRMRPDAIARRLRREPPAPRLSAREMRADLLRDGFTVPPASWIAPTTRARQAVTGPTRSVLLMYRATRSTSSFVYGGSPKNCSRIIFMADGVEYCASEYVRASGFVRRFGARCVA